MTVYEVLEVEPLPRKMLPCLYCKVNRQLVSGFCSSSHEKKYRDAAVGRLLRTPGGVGSVLVAVMGEKDRVVAERKAKRREVGK